jgi:hypothetical protein
MFFKKRFVRLGALVALHNPLILHLQPVKKPAFMDQNLAIKADDCTRLI